MTGERRRYKGGAGTSEVARKSCLPGARLGEVGIPSGSIAEPKRGGPSTAVPPRSVALKSRGQDRRQWRRQWRGWVAGGRESKGRRSRYGRASQGRQGLSGVAPLQAAAPVVGWEAGGGRDRRGWLRVQKFLLSGKGMGGITRATYAVPSHFDLVCRLAYQKPSGPTARTCVSESFASEHGDAVNTFCLAWTTLATLSSRLNSKPFDSVRHFPWLLPKSRALPSQCTERHKSACTQGRCWRCWQMPRSVHTLSWQAC